MRINVYSQELTKESELVSKPADTGITYYGVRLWLASPDILHHTAQDDDRSAITFWLPNARSFTKSDLAAVFRRMADQIDLAPDIPDLRASAHACLACGMLADVDPELHHARYGHRPRYRDDDGTVRVWFEGGGGWGVVGINEWAETREENAAP